MEGQNNYMNELYGGDCSRQMHAGTCFGDCVEMLESKDILFTTQLIYKTKKILAQSHSCRVSKTE